LGEAGAGQWRVASDESVMADKPEIVGLKELGDTLDLLSNNVQKKHIRTAMKPAAEVFRREMRLRAPQRVEVGTTGFRKTGKGKKQRQPGYLKKHIGRWIRPSSDGSLSAFVGPTPSAFYGRFSELGSSHQPAKPFMRPTFDLKKDEAAATFATTLEQEIGKDLRK
jgi:HK97 gp10 family phage protein